MRRKPMDAFITTIRREALEAEIDATGAQLMSLSLGGDEYLWQGDGRWWPRRAPILFPIVGCLRGGEATSAAGPVRLGRHGLARDLVHRVSRRGDDFVTYELSSSPETIGAFPYLFRLDTTYRLVGPATLEQSFEVTNVGEVPLPFVVGGHPAFNVPAPRSGAELFSDYELRFARRWTYATPTVDASSGLLDFQRTLPLLEDASAMPLTHRTFDVDTLVFQGVPESTVELVGTKGGHGVRLDFAGFDYLGVWSAAGDAPFVAVEPWSGCATATDEDDVFEHKRGMTVLAPGGTCLRSFRVTLL